ncbi:MAG: M14 family metallopeptidase, partial [Planctomycetota bacterium]
LAREIALADDHPLLERHVLLIAPIYNADGNDRMATGNRPGQVGPEEGMGERANAAGFDLNRDYMKLESPEARALVRLLDTWDPHLSIDTHTTNGSRHRYTLTYDSPLHPSSPAGQVAFLRDELLPDVTERLRERTGYDTFFYGNFNRDHTIWATYSQMPRFGANYQGLRGQMAILSEAYSYAPYRDRVLCTLEFVREILTFSAEQHDRIRALHDDARRTVTDAGRAPQPTDLVGLRHRPAAFTRPVTVRGYEPRPRPRRGGGDGDGDGGGRRAAPTRDDGATPAPVDHRVVHLGRFEATLSVPRPAGYVVPGDLEQVIETLRLHGVQLEPCAGRVTAERYTVLGIERARRPFQGHRIATLDVRAEEAVVDVPPGSWLVRTAQPLGTLIVQLLEPQSEDGLAAWNFLDDRLAEGATYPILRVPRTSGLPAP